MDRLMHTTAVRNLPLLLALFSLIPAGCKSTKRRGSPRKTVSDDRARLPRSAPAVMRIPAPPGAWPACMATRDRDPSRQDMQNSTAPSRDITYGMPAPGATNLGAPTANRYGPPATSGTSDSSPSGSASIADSMLRSVPPASKMLQKDPEATRRPALLGKRIPLIAGRLWDFPLNRKERDEPCTGRALRG